MSQMRSLLPTPLLFLLAFVFSGWSVAADAGFPVSISPPTASVNEGGAKVKLTASSSGGSGIVTYSWAPKGGAPADASARLSGTIGTSVFFDPPDSVTGDTVYTYVVTATDSGTGTPPTAEVKITVKNVPLDVDIAGASDFNEGTTKTLTANESGGESPYTYKWEITSGAAVAKINGSSTGKTVKIKGKEVTVDTSITVKLTVSDSSSPADSKSVTKTMKVKNVTVAFSPSITGAGDFNEGATKMLTASVGGGKSPFTYKWAITSGAAAVAIDGNSTGKTVKLKGKEVSADTPISIKLTVTDSSSPKLTKSTTVSMKVKNVTAAFNPSIIGAGNFNEGATRTLTANEGGGKKPYSYKWEIVSGKSAVQIDGGNTGKAVKLKGREVTANTPITVKVTVTDSSLPKQHKSATTTMNVLDVPKAPVAHAGGDQTVEEGKLVTLDGSKSKDPDGQIKSYIWESLDDPGIVLADSSMPTFTAPRVGKAGKNLRFSLKVKDDKGLVSKSDEVLIKVSNTINDAPVAVIKALTDSVKPGAEFSLDASSSTDQDGNGTIVKYEWKQKDDDAFQVQFLERNEAVGRFRAPGLNQTMQLTLIVTVTDDQGESSTAEQVVTVSADPSLKQPRAEAGLDEIAEAGAMVTLDGSKSRDQNEDGSLVSYHWTQLEGPDVEIGAADTAKASFKAPAEVAELTFQLKVVDNDNLFATDTVSVFVGPKGALLIDAGQDQTNVYEGSTVSLSGVVLNGSGNEQKFRWRQVDATGTNVILSAEDASNVYFVTPSVDSDKTLEFELIAWDGGTGLGVDSVKVHVRDNAISVVPSTFLPVRAATDSEEPLGFDIQSGNLVSLKPKAVPLNERATQKNRPKKIPYGLFDFTLRVDRPGDSATLRIWFPDDVSTGFGWYKYNSGSQVWSSYDSEMVAFNGHELLLTLTDGGPGDDDGKADGFIRDPGGLGSVIAKEKTRIEGSSGGGALGGVIALLAAGLGLRRRERRVA